MINAAPGSARHAAIPRPHSAVAGGGTLRQCSRCRRREPRVRFHATSKCSYCVTCWAAYLRERYAARRIERGYSYTPRKRTVRQSAALDLTDCLKGWR